jgi:hypothetical protein
LIQTNGKGAGKEMKTVFVKRCARCEKDHDVDFEFVNDDPDYPWVGLCLNTKEPVRMKIVEGKNMESKKTPETRKRYGCGDK